jgi:hypothetical protein
MSQLLNKIRERRADLNTYVKKRPDLENSRNDLELDIVV